MEQLCSKYGLIFLQFCYLQSLWRFPECFMIEWGHKIVWEAGMEENTVNHQNVQNDTDGKNEEKKTEKRRVKRLDNITGFNIMVNLYILRYLYTRMDKNKGEGRFFYSDVVDISRQKFQKICNGIPFSFGKDRCKALCRKFNISETYFSENGSIIEINGLDENAWKNYFNRHFPALGKWKYQTTFATPVQQEKLEEELVAILKKHSKKGFIEETYKSTEAIFRIWYYFEKGATFTSVSNLDKFINDLSTIECTDWNVYAGNGEKLQTCIDVMQKHVRYMMALKIIGEYENK